MAVAGGHEYKALALNPGYRGLDSVPVLNNPPPKAESQQEPARHPWSILIILVWMGYIGGTGWLLERAVRLAPTTTSPPWTVSTLPTFLITVFTQAHGPITGFYLARLAISALQSPSTAPRDWHELFSLANRDWQSPIGLVTFFKGMRRRCTFLYLMIPCLLALLTPTALEHAYPIKTVDVIQMVTIHPNTMSLADIGAVDGYSQTMIGGGTWSTGLSITEALNTSIYTPAGVPRTSSPHDFFMAGDINGADVTVPGIRVQGSCAPLNSSSFNDTDAFDDFCATKLNANESSNAGKYYKGEFSVMYMHASASGTCCINQAFDAGPWYDPPGSAGTSSFMWINGTNTTQSTSGVLQCNVNVTIGRAALNGRQGTFDAFEFDNSTIEYNGGEVIQHPHLLAYWRLTEVRDQSQYNWGSQVSMLGYREGVLGDGEGEISLEQPTIEGFAEQMWRGTSHMAAAAALQARRADNSYTAVVHAVVAGRVREKRLAMLVLALLGLWLLMLVVCTLRMSPVRKTFGGSLDSYVVARLAMDRPELFEGQRVGDLSGHQ